MDYSDSNVDNDFYRINSNKSMKTIFNKYKSINKPVKSIDKIDIIKPINLVDVIDLSYPITNIDLSNLTDKNINIPANISVSTDINKIDKHTRKLNTEKIEIKETNNNSYINQNLILQINSALKTFIKIIVDYFISIISKKRLLNEIELGSITKIFSMKMVVNTIYLIICYIIETIINFTYNKIIKDSCYINTILESDLLFENKEYVNLDCFPLINNDTKLSNGNLQEFVNENAEDILLSNKDSKMRDKAVNLLNGELIKLFDCETMTNLSTNSTNEDINRVIIDFAVEIDKLVLLLLEKKKILGHISHIFDISINLRFTISYLAASSIYRIIKSSIYLVNDLFISKTSLNIITIVIHNLYNNNLDNNSEILYKKFIDYLKYNTLKTNQS